tara:strand:- start:558 stop:710 length:153 start_codon:yes stop_codon:yes gene_type:complete
MTTTTVIRQADWVVASSEAKSSHVYLHDVDFVFSETEILFVGVHYEEEVS